MLTTKRQPASVAEIMTEEFIEPLGLALVQATGVPRQHVNELCNDRRGQTAATAFFLARAIGNTPALWLNTRRRTDLCKSSIIPRSAS